MADHSSWRPNLPSPMILGTALAGGGGGFYLLSSILPYGAMWILWIGMAAVGLLVCLFVGLVRWRDRRKSRALEGEIAQARDVPGIGAGSRAGLEDMRRKFQQGIDKLRKIRIRVGELPWYVIVGETGSGKTEAIRHSGIRWPESFQEPQQGIGGTLNMDWWFCKHAVILDTAGKLVFPEVQAGQSTGWREFLRLLRANRANCPINGMILAIPADSLLQDSAETIERKSGKIAEQLELLKSELDVRFPVYLVITKSDKIWGFREFFENVRDPRMVHQILGWSNSDSLDKPFAPEDLEKHFQSLLQQLSRRRLGLLAPAGGGPDAAPRRLSDVDSLYAFPQAMSILVSNLKLYLETIFAGDEMMGMPLFLRGVYFTSAMQEGAALDAELLKAGIDIEKLRPDNRIWTRERSCFLRDLLLEKVFRETGLVTRASNASGQHRRRKLAVLGAGLASVLVLMAFTLYGWFALRGSVGGQAKLWEQAATTGWTESNDWRPVVGLSCAGGPYVYQDGGLAWLNDAWKLKDQKIRVPWIFSLARIKNNIDPDRARALGVVFERCVTRPLAEAAGDVMRRDATERPAATGPATNPAQGPLDPNFVPALAELIRLEAARRNPATRGLESGADEALRLDALFGYDVREGTWPRAVASDLQKKLRELHLRGGMEQAWPSEAFHQKAYFEPAQKAIEAGARLFAGRGWDVEGARIRDANEGFDQAARALKAFRDAEDRLLQMEEDYKKERAKQDLARGPMGLQDYEWVEREWRGRYDAVKKAESDLAEASAKLRELLLGGSGGKGLLEGVRDRGEEKKKEINAAYRVPMDATGIGKGQGSPAGDPNDFLVKLYDRLDGNREYWVKQVDSQVNRILVDLVPRSREFDRHTAPNSPLFYGLRLKTYAVADGQVAKSVAASRPSSQGSDANDAVGALLPQLARIDADANASLAVLPPRPGPATTPSTAPEDQAQAARDAQGRRLCQAVIRRSQSYRKYFVLKDVLAALPKDPGGWGDLVARACRSPVRLPQIPLVALDQARASRYDPAAAGPLLASWRTVENISWQEAVEGASLEALFRLTRDSVEEYKSQYVKYWSEMVLDPPVDPKLNTWAACRQALALANANLTNADLMSVGQAVQQALSAAGPFVDPKTCGKTMADANDAIRGGNETMAQPRFGVFGPRCTASFDNVKQLGAAVADARKGLIAKTPEDVFDCAILGKGYIQNYWTAVLAKAIGLLAAEFQADLRKQVDGVQVLVAFPLVNTAGGNMKGNGVAQAQGLINACLVDANPKPGTLAAGGRTNLEKIDAPVKLLLNRSFLEGEEDWLKGMLQIASVAQKRVAVEGDGNMEGQLQGGVCLIVDGKAGDWRATGAGATKFGSESCEAGLELQFKQYPSDANATGFAKLRSPWSSIHLVLDPKAARDAGDPKSWLVSVPVTDAAGVAIKGPSGKPLTYSIRLTFADPLPDAGKWPGPKPVAKPKN